MSFRLRIPLLALAGGILRILFYARYSTDDQDESSIPDQFEFCRQFLAQHGITEFQAIYESDPETSGEMVSRPGINRVREIVASRQCDVIICEDSSRLFRHVTAAGELIDTAVDLGIRVICINDDVDTAEVREG